MLNLIIPITIALAMSTRHRGLRAFAIAAILLSVLPASAAQARNGTTKPTIVFVHGAFADASGFGAVTDRLEHDGYTVISPANPLRGPASDAAYVASLI